MKILINYFSGTGNTKKVASLYENILLNLSHDVVMNELNSKEDKEFNIDEYDYLGIGYPIHAFNAPRIILDFCLNLPKSNKKVFIFKTSGEPIYLNDISSLKAIQILKRKGYIVTNEYHYVMPYNIIFRHSDEMAYRMWKTAKAIIPLDIQEILNNTPRHLERTLCDSVIAWIFRVEHFGAHFNGKFYKVNQDCINCKLCINTCPVNNISINDKGKFKFGTKCIMCMRCSFNCPKDAIKIGLFQKWKVNGKYSFSEPTEVNNNYKHANYCKNAYEQYFMIADERINKANNKNEFEYINLEPNEIISHQH